MKGITGTEQIAIANGPVSYVLLAVHITLTAYVATKDEEPYSYKRLDSRLHCMHLSHRIIILVHENDFKD